ncbi:helix-turn-helix domain-containing protein [Leeia sp.]|uniref:AraC family transcriptional regulator n=1 Tax=Leeia sp. TaxID=2884678 RepID=UPI0035ADE3D6
MPTATPRKRLDFQHLTSPLIALDNHWPSGSSTGWHTHPRGQLLYAIHGVMKVETEAGSYVIPPSRALWMRPGLRHNVTMAGTVEMRTVYLDTTLMPELPARSGVVHVSPLLRELLLAAVQLPHATPETDRARCIRQLLVDELHSASTLPLHLPLPHHPVLQRLCQTLCDHPADPRNATAWARELDMSERSLHRLFTRETGLPFTRWRDQARLFAALTALAEGRKGLDAAFHCGFSSQSAFVAWFRRQTGDTPAAYYREG